jgi:hypothetical protein
MPPMLNIALKELMRRMEQYLSSNHLRLNRK